MARHEFEGSRQGARARTAGADKDTRRGIELMGIVSESPIPPFASGFTVNNCGHLTAHSRITRLSAQHVFANLIRGREGEHIFSDQMAKPTKSLESPHGAGCLSLKTGFSST